MHLGVAISLRGGGLVAPAVHDADRLSLTELMAALRDLTARARGGRLRGSEMTDATITVTNLGDRGVRAVFGVIYPPQVALVGFGKISDRVCDVDNGLGIRPAVTATLVGRSPRDRRPHRCRLPHRGRAPPPPPRGAVMPIDPDAAMRAALAAIAPEADLDDVGPDEDLQEALDLDSMDFLNFLIAIAQSTGVEIPESDYHLVRTYAGCKDYLARHGA